MSEEQKVPSKEEVVTFLKEQIEVKELQAQLQELNMRIAKARAEEIQAISFIAQLTNPSQPPVEPEMEGEPHTITEEDLANNPSLSEQGLKVGDEVLITDEEAPKKRSLKKK
ncbi:MAG: hypothetical protein ACK5XN_21535 [Bacteroidota bacterium]|jgi:hypothetical protein